MKPIPSPISKEALDLMNKAQFMIERIDTIEKKLEMVEHEGKQVPAFAADGKGEKDLKEKEKVTSRKLSLASKRKVALPALKNVLKNAVYQKPNVRKLSIKWTTSKCLHTVMLYSQMVYKKVVRSVLNVVKE